MRCALRAAALAAAGSLCVCAASASAAVLYQTSFEEPAFTAGNNLSGQDGWTQSTGNGTMFVQNAAGLAHTGSQYATYNTSTATGSTGKWDWKPLNVPATAFATEPILTASVWSRINSSATTRTVVAGIDLYNIAGNRIAAINFGQDGAVLPLNPTGPVTVTTPVTASLDAYHELKVVANFNTKEVDYFFDGTLFATSTATTFTNLGDGDIYAIRTTNPAGSSGGHDVFWDDLSLVTSPVPEPAAVTLVPLALGALSARRRRA